MKFMRKHYVFIIIVALLTLILGLSFSLMPSKKLNDQTEASVGASGAILYSIGYKQPWEGGQNYYDKGDGTYTTYINRQGVEIPFYGSIGEISPSIIKQSAIEKIEYTKGTSSNFTNETIETAIAKTSDGSGIFCKIVFNTTSKFWMWESVTYNFSLRLTTASLFNTFEPVESYKDFVYEGTQTGSWKTYEGKTYFNQVQPKETNIHLYANVGQCVPSTNYYAQFDDETIYEKIPTYCYDSFYFLNSSTESTFWEGLKNAYNLAGFNIGWSLVSGSLDTNNRFQTTDQYSSKDSTYLNEELYNRFSFSQSLELPTWWNGDGITVKESETVNIGDCIIVPTLTPKTYTITFDVNGGSGTNSSKNVKFGEPYPDAYIVSPPTNYVLEGYFDSKTGGNRYYWGDGTPYYDYHTETKSLTLYAQYKRATYNLTFNPNGGAFATGATTTIKATYGEQYPAITLSPATLPTGKYFAGYYTAASGGTQIYDSSLKVVKGAKYTSTSNTTLYAQYLPNNYTIYYYDSGGPSASASVSVKYGDSLSLRTPEKTGHYFAHWTLGENGATTYSGTITVPNWGSNGISVGLYAVWTAETYRFEFDSNGGSSVRAQNYTYGITYTLPAPTRTGYTFAGWKINGNSTAVSGSYTVNTDFGNNGATVSCVAQWTPIGYTVRFNGNGGAITAGATTVDQAFTYNKKQQLKSNAFVKSGYIFTGWAESVGGSVAYYNMQEVINLASTKGAIKNLYAVWGETWLNNVQAPSLEDTSQTNSASNPYLITSEENLAWMALQTQTSSLSGYYQQTKELDLSGKEWIPIGKNQACSFIGNFDGNGYEIKNIKISAMTNVKRENNGLFGYCSSNATLKNIIVSSGEINGNGAYTGGIVGRIEGSGQVKNCVNFATVNSTSDNVGGIVGGGSVSEILSCANYANIKGIKYVGGIVGYASTSNGTISQCYVNAKISGTAYVGGLVGIQSLSSGEISLSFSAFDGTIEATSFYGSFAGSIYTGSSVTDCYAKAIVPDNAPNYGLVGNNSSVINNCVFEIKESSKTSYTKYYRGTSFENWVMTSSGIPAPSGLTWIGTGGTKITDIQDLRDQGYTSV